MKRCPECGRDYYDDSLLYCLADGAHLLEGPASADEPATAILHSTDSVSESATRRFARSTDQAAGIQDKAISHRHVASKRNTIIAGTVGMLFVTVLGLASYWLYGRGSSRQIESIAVMPFVNESGNADVEYLSDGMTETLISALSRLPNLSVKPRSSVFRYKGKETNVQTIGRELGVQAILHGRVVQRGDQVTLGLELVDVAKDAVIWSEQYNRRQSDLVSLQTDIARDVSNKLKARLSGAEEQSVAKSYTANSDAYQLYLKGRYYWNKRTAENIRKAMEQFQQAADADPNYALAYAGLADCYAVVGDYTGIPESETVPKTQAFAKRALELDGSLVEARTALAYSYHLSWQWAGGEREYRQAIEVDPNYPTAHHWFSLLLIETGRFNEAVAEIKRAQELDPLSQIISYNVALNYLLVGDLNSSIEQSKRLIDLDPNFPRAHQSLGQAYLKQERYPEAIAEFQKAVSLSPGDRQALRDLGFGFAVSGKRVEALAVLKHLQANYEKREAFASDVAAVFAGLGDKDQAFSWIEKDFQGRMGRLARIRYHIVFESLRSDLRYADLLRRMGLSS